MTPVWEAISRLERQGFKVLSLTCDGASSNRRLWQLHKEDRKKSKKQITRDPQSDGNAEKDRDDDDTDDTEEELLHKVPNVFASDGPRYIYFFSDPTTFTEDCPQLLEQQAQESVGKFLIFKTYVMVVLLINVILV